MTAPAALEPQAETRANPAIYVGCLAAYNNGKLHGAWIELTPGITADDMHERVTAILESSPEHDPHGLYGPAEEWAIHDFEGFDGYHVDENEDFDRLAAIANAIATQDHPKLAWLESHHWPDPDTYPAAAYIGAYDSATDWAEQHTEQLHERVRRAAESFGHARNKNAGPHVDLTDLALAIRIDLDEVLMIARSNWGFQFLDHGGKTHVFYTD